MMIGLCHCDWQVESMSRPLGWLRSLGSWPQKAVDLNLVFSCTTQEPNSTLLEYATFPVHMVFCRHTVHAAYYMLLCVLSYLIPIVYCLYNVFIVCYTQSSGLPASHPTYNLFNYVHWWFACINVAHCVLSSLEVAFTGKSVAMVVKSNKTLQEALASLLQKHRLQPQDVFVTMVSTAFQWLEVCPFLHMTKLF